MTKITKERLLDAAPFTANELEEVRRLAVSAIDDQSVAQTMPDETALDGACTAAMNAVSSLNRMLRVLRANNDMRAIHLTNLIANLRECVISYPSRETRYAHTAVVKAHEEGYRVALWHLAAGAVMEAWRVSKTTPQSGITASYILEALSLEAIKALANLGDESAQALL